MKIKAGLSAALISTLFVAAACGGGKTQQQSSAVFDEADIAAIILQATDAPAGTQHQPDDSGSQTVDDIADDANEKTLLTDAGFTAAHQASFVTPALLTADDPSEVPAGARLIGAVAIGLRDAAGATRILDEFRKDFTADAQGVGTLSAQGGVPGDTGYAYSFSALDTDTPLGGFTIIWRHGNGVFAIIAAGVPGAATEAETLSLAATMNGRAKARA